MAKTDHSLKRLITNTINEFAAWVLDAEVASTKEVASEHTYPPEPIRSDLVFEVTLADKREVLMPIEFQGRSSRRPVHLRLLDYMSRSAINDKPRRILHAVVVYVGESAGPNDTGIHQVEGLEGEPALLWRYQVVRLWQMRAEELLALDRPALLPLVGLTQMEQPAHTVAEVIARLKAVQDAETHGRLLADFIALLPGEELMNMARQIIEKDGDILIESPYLKYISEQSHQEGIVKGHEKGLAEGLSKGREEGIEEGIEEGLSKGREEGIEQGHMIALRENILDALMIRFDPPVSIYRTIEGVLETITDEQTLRSLFKQVMQAENPAEFQQAVEQVQAQGNDK